MDANVILEAKPVCDIEGIFFVPSYQRGYRWGREEVRMLLRDIYGSQNENYCLQPIVVRRGNGVFELIDGQQRLTTIYLLLQYIKREYKPRIQVKYRLSYETREKSEEFLEHIDKGSGELADLNADFYHMFQAYREIGKWFGEQQDDVIAADDMYGCLAKRVRVIWYEVGEEEDAISLFKRLNIGKIPLTSAELVRAMFLRRGGDVDKERQKEIAFQWDEMERELHHDGLWYFLTNRAAGECQTRIDLVLDLISKKPERSLDPYFTFFWFDENRGGRLLEGTWEEIRRTFLSLKDWYEDHEYYHKVGYLVASGTKTLQQIYDLSAGRTKGEFRESLDDAIRKSIAARENYAEMSYENSADYEKIGRLLLLFNVESVRQNGDGTEWFPFDKFKFSQGGRTAWSLEHIHARQSEGMRTQEAWREWLRMHAPSVRAVDVEDGGLARDMEEAAKKPRLERGEFEELQKRAAELLSARGGVESLDAIGNLALLNVGDNAALGCSAFDVKRNAVIEMDKRGQYIPFCTRMAFLKYYTPSEENQVHFWGIADRRAYVGEMNRILKAYLEDPIELEREGG